MPRPKEFDPDQALEKAMQVFWRKGYEAASIQDLVEQMGINRFSLYDTFGDKHQLFLAALERYRQKMAYEKLQPIENSQEGLGVIRRYFSDILGWALSEQGRHGCLITNSAVEMAPHDQETAACIRAHLKRMDAVFHKALLRAREKGEIGKTRNLRDLARFLTSSAQGLAVLAKARPERKELEGPLRTIFAALK